MSQAIIKTLTNTDGSEVIYPRTTKEAVHGLGNVIYAHGDEVEAEVENEYLKYTPQTFTEDQKAQVRSNIGAADVNEVALKHHVCNPNLLDNWYFGNPVNQRGQTEYSNSDWEAVYCIDRWWNNVSTFNVLERKITSIANYGRLGQFLNNKELIGKTVTFSILIDSCVNTCPMLLLNDQLNGDYAAITGQPGQTGLISMTTNIKDFGNGNLYANILSTAAEGSITILAAKLELGDTQTLAHQDASGNWVLNEIPDYGEQLARCQRYFFAIKGTTYSKAGFGQAEASAVFPIVNIPTPMRTRPVVTYSGNWKLWDGNSEIGIQSMSTSPGATSSADCPQISLAVYGTSATTVGKIYTLTVRNDGTAYMWFSADL